MLTEALYRARLEIEDLRERVAVLEEAQMPIKSGKDSKGCFVQWGNQKKYYYKCGDQEARARAVAKARAQERAIRASGWKE